MFMAEHVWIFGTMAIICLLVLAVIVVHDVVKARRAKREARARAARLYVRDVARMEDLHETRPIG